MTEIMTEKELKQEYEDFIKTDAGKQWKKKWVERFDYDDVNEAGNFEDYLYDYYPEMLQ